MANLAIPKPAVISRKEAQVRGLIRFYTGVPCSTHGHLVERYVSNGGCVACVNWKVAAGVPMSDPRAFVLHKALMLPNSYLKHRSPDFLEMYWQVLFNEVDVNMLVCQRALARLEQLQPLRTDNVHLTAKADPALALVDYLNVGWTLEKLLKHGYIARDEAVKVTIPSDMPDAESIKINNLSTGTLFASR